MGKKRKAKKNRNPSRSKKQSHAPISTVKVCPNPETAALQAEIQTHMSSENYKAAVETFEKLNLLHPNDGQLLTGMATAQALGGWFDDAVNTQKRAAALFPQSFKYRFNLLKILTMANDYAAAGELADELASQCPDERLQELNEITQTLSQAAPGQPPENAPLTERPLHVLFLQTFPCIRNYKTATALRGRGHKVDLAYTERTLSQMYKGLSDDVYNRCIKVKGTQDLWNLTGNYDLVHCHNEPDWPTVSALGGDAPVVHDTHDLISLRDPGNINLSLFEGLANRRAHGRIYTTPYQKDIAQDLYGVKGPALTFYNYISAADRPTRNLPKLSEKDGGTHMVYEGSMGNTPHRDFGPLFIELAQRGIQMHIYPSQTNQNLVQQCAPYPQIHFYQPLSPKQIMEEMTQFDAGIIPFNLEKGNKKFLDSTIANKLFEYLAAGLPVLTSPLQSYVDYFSANPVGAVYDSADDIVQKLPSLISMAKSNDLTAYAKSYEGEVERLEAFYHQVIEAFKKTTAGDARFAYNADFRDRRF